MSWFDKYFATNKKKPDKPQVLDELYKVPKKDKGKNMPHFQVLAKDYVNQADLLYLPEDAGHKYLLVVVDANSRLTDAEPLTGKSSEDVLQAFKKIYGRKILKLPKRLEVDPGTEFKGVARDWFLNQGIDVRVGKAGRHRQQAIVETRNGIIGTAILKRQAAEELLTGEPAVAWVDDIPGLITAMNKRTKSTTVPLKPAKEPVCEDGACELLEKGTKVRVMLEEPKSLQGKKLHGKFRRGDVRFDENLRTIKEVLLKPGFPPMYLLDGAVGDRKVEPIAYTKNQLQIVNPEEQYPSQQVIKDVAKVKTFRIERILEKKKIRRKWMLRIKWRGFDEETWEPYKTIKEDQPKAVAEFEEDN